MIYLILCLQVSAHKILQSQWLDSPNCEGPPNIMLLYTISTVTVQMANSHNSTRASLFESQMEDADYGSCGVAFGFVDGGCCYSVLDLSLSGGYKSGRPALINDTNGQKRLPLEANNNAYCNVSLVEDYNGSHVGFLSILAHTDRCIDQRFKCYTNQSLSYYSEDNCEGTVTNMALTQTAIFVDSLGNASYQIVSGGESTKTFTTYIPNTLSVAPNTSVNGILQWLLFAIAISCDLWNFISLFTKFNAKRTRFNGACLVNQIIWIVHSVIHLIYWRIPLPNTSQSKTLQGSMLLIISFCQNIGTLFSTLQTMKVFVAFRMVTDFKRPEWAIKYFLIALHFLGGYYVGVCHRENNGIPFCIPTHLAKLWSRINPIWIIIVFLWNTIPILYIAATISSKMFPKLTLLQKCSRIYGLCSKTFQLLVLQIFFALSYVVIAILTGFTIGPVDSFETYTGFVICTTILSVHSCLNTLLLEAFAKFVTSIAPNVTVTTEAKTNITSIKDT
ncbi:hypothetical protein HDV02_005281 [Globomyces sp. JEL0801]|nr:hypothetical protein HDV02_005281 [Globomyces sp. JEL0801]